MKSMILLVEDEIDLGNVVKQYLEVMDFEVDWSTNGQDAFERCKRKHYHILLIDISIPGMDGFELASHLLKTNINIPFLFLTARSEKSDKLHGLKIGADDYVTKPFDIDELVLRIKNIIKRNQGVAASPIPGFIEIGNIKFHKANLKLVIDNQREVVLTQREADLLEFLFKNANRVIKREEILTQLWGENDYFLGRSLDVFISRLRKHMGNNENISITNIYGVGFVFNVKSGGQ